MPVTLTPAQHFSARHVFDRNRALWGGFTMRTGGQRLFFAGDTAYGRFFSEVRERLGPIEACRARSIPPSRFHTLGFGESLRLDDEGGLHGQEGAESAPSGFNTEATRRP